MADIEFMDCTSLNISYSVLGLVTITYTMVHNKNEFVTLESITVGTTVFTGYIANASLNVIPKTEGWFETHATLIATAA